MPYASLIRESPAVYAEEPDSDELKVLKLARRQGHVARNDVEDLLEVSASTASRILRRMVSDNLLRQRGKARSTIYIPVR